MRSTSPKQARPVIDVVDFFSGCGGMSHGFLHAASSHVRYRLAGAVDVDAHANATYERMSGVRPLARDIRDIRGKFVSRLRLEWGLDEGRPLVLIGCAPCQGFSSHRKKDARVDTRNDLLEVFARVAISLRPELIVMENVPEVFDARYWHHFVAWREALTRRGYRVRAQIMNLAQFGVPQERFRALIVASRIWDTFAMPQGRLTPRNYRTVREAIGGLPKLEAGGRDPHDPMHLTSRHRAATVDLIRQIPRDGGSRRALPKGVGPECWSRVDGFRDVYGRMAWDRPSVAITARCRTPSCGRFVHPEQHRGLSVREAALLQGFPASFMFEGPFDDKFKQIGNAVSPIFAKAIASHLGREWHIGGSADVDESIDITRPLTKSFSSSIAAIKRRDRLAA